MTLLVGSNGGTAGGTATANKKVAQKKASNATPTDLGSGGLGPKGNTLNVASTNPNYPQTSTPTAAEQSGYAPPTPQAPAPPPPPTFYYGLNPDQMLSYGQAYGKDQQVIDAAPGQQANDLASWQNNTAQLAQQTAQNNDMENQNAAARGFGFSSVHDGAMADIQANAVMNQNNFNLAYNTGIAQLTTNVNNARNDQGILDNTYLLQGAANAQAEAIANGGVADAGDFGLNTLAGYRPASGQVSAPALPNPVKTTYMSGAQGVGLAAAGNPSNLVQVPGF